MEISPTAVLYMVWSSARRIAALQWRTLIIPSVPEKLSAIARHALVDNGIAKLCCSDEKDNDGRDLIAALGRAVFNHSSTGLEKADLYFIITKATMARRTGCFCAELICQAKITDYVVCEVRLVDVE